MRRKIVLSILFALIMVKFVYSYNPSHYSAVSRGTPDSERWVKWRKKHPGIRPDLSHAFIDYLSFGGNFRYVNFRHAKLIDCPIARADFTGSDFSYSLIKKCRVLNAPDYFRAVPTFTANRFYKAKIVESYFNRTKFINVSFSEAKIYKSTFLDCYFKKMSFIRAEIIDSKLINREFYFVDFSNSYIRKTQIIAEKPNYVNFKNAKIIECFFRFHQSNAVNFSNADLTGSVFDGSKLTNVNFTNANLTNVNLTRTIKYSKETTFKNVIFKNADMKGTKVNRKWYNYIKRQGVRNFDKIVWEG